MAKMPTFLLCVRVVAGFTAGTMPTNGTWGKVVRKVRRAAAEAVLHATTMSLAPWFKRK